MSHRKKQYPDFMMGMLLCSEETTDINLKAFYLTRQKIGSTISNAFQSMLIISPQRCFGHSDPKLLYIMLS
jgi:hypothetical protein